MGLFLQGLRVCPVPQDGHPRSHRDHWSEREPGFLVAKGQLVLWAVVIIGAVGNLAGSLLAYWIGSKGGRPLIEKYGKYILILNPDITLLPGSVEKAIHFLEEHPEVSLLLPKLLNPDGTLQFSCRTFPDFSAFLYRRTPLGKLFPHHKVIREHLMLDWEHDEIREVDWGMGACMFLRREDLKDQSIFDERFFLYFEDIDLCFRLKNEGRKVIYYPEAAMVHYHVRESVRGFITLNWAKWELYKSVFKFYFKHHKGRSKNGRG